jgi:WD40 repeat protein
VVWEVKTKKVLWTKEAEGGLVDFEFSPTGKLLAYTIGLSNQPALLVDSESGKLVRKLEDNCTGVAFSVDGKLLITNGDHLTIWDLASGASLEQRRLADTGIQITGRGDKTVYYATGVVAVSRPGVQAPEKLDGDVNWVVLSPDGRVLAAHTATSVTLFDARTMTKAKSLNFVGHAVDDLERPEEALRLGAFTPDGKSLILPFARSIRWYSIPDLTPGRVWNKGFNGLGGAAVSADGKRIAVDDDETVKVLDAQANEVRMIATFKP